MIRALLAMGRRATKARVRRVIALATLNGLAQGAVLACLVPIAVALLHGDMHQLWTWILVLVIACIVTAVFVVASTMGSFDISLEVMEDMHLGLGHRMVRLPLGWFSSSSTARASNIVVRGTIFVAGATTDALVPVVTSVATPIAVAIVILAFDWRIGLALLAAMALVLLVSRLANNANRKSEDLVHSTTLETDKRLLEFADDQVTLRSAGLRGSDYQPLALAIEERRKAGRKSVFASIIAMIPQGFAIDICFSLAIALAVLRAISGDADPVAMIALVALATQVSGPLRVISELMTTLRRAELELGEVNDVLGTPGMDTPEVSTAEVRDNTVRLDNVHFSYDPAHPVLDGVDLTLAAGKVTALVGPSGSGKTTVTRLIARFWDPDSGSVSIGGVDVRDLSDEDRMAQLSLVFQDSYLFDETLWENVALGNQTAGEEQVLRAAELAQVTAIAERFPSGWHTRVGQGGSLLSGGERQRVSIARAFVKDAPVLLLDEATAALDPILAHTVQAALDHFRGRATILVIAHQADTIANADSIAFIEDGRIRAQGTHTQLLQTDPRYVAFWQGRIAAEQWHIAGVAK